MIHRKKPVIPGFFLLKKELPLAMIMAALLAGCESKTETGALIGSGKGALVGSAVSVASGYALDQQDRDTLEQRSPGTLDRIDKEEQLSIEDIKKMSNAGIKDDVIINQTDATNSRYDLTSEEIIELKNSGVSQNVINHMIQTGNR